MRLKIGIQGDECSTNEKACKFFVEKYQWKDYEIKYCISTERVLSALEKNKIDYGTFAWKSSRYDLVQETQEAIKRHPYTKIDEVELQIDHALLCNSEIKKYELIRIFSHPQALKEHQPFLEKEFPYLELVNESDTGTAAKKLKQNEYPDNSLIIAPINCAQRYRLNVYMGDLARNDGYVTTIYLVKK